MDFLNYSLVIQFLNWPPLVKFLTWPQWVHLALSLFAGFFLSAGIVQGRIYCGKCQAKKDKFRLLKERLDNYGLMQNLDPELNGDRTINSLLPISSTRPVLSSGSHKILLGVLKKIETKNAVAMSVVFLLLSGMWSLAGDVREYGAGFPYAYAAIIGFLVGPLFAGLDGLGHIGQPHYTNLSKRSSNSDYRSGEFRARQMQQRLMLDLVAKEYGFQAKIGVIAIAVLLVLLLVISTLSTELFEEEPILTIEFSLVYDDT